MEKVENAKRSRPNSLFEVANRIRAGETSAVAMGGFLDAYPASAMGDRPSFLQERPGSVDLSDPWRTRVMDASLSAVAEFLACRDRLPAPDWVFDREYFLDRPWFACSSDGMRPLLIMESPVSFRRRNLFVSKNALSRA